ncbi:unnamed protein product [Vitrella brassicaformis CCMP3155]|uniref:Uncharacterized protein n=1 Tax=Vitrella brassicaformis (strain CCMP3155) TaxID=1169540 RepID=A0A0G4EIW8_VITBC|nr:unnamed protein product [Vitrella brassicaformis CCMP3155]|eukprot:CEL96961.1 unnamed protein product [Vitrella brassicaformis CCMP3155]
MQRRLRLRPARASAVREARHIGEAPRPQRKFMCGCLPFPRGLRRPKATRVTACGEGDAPPPSEKEPLDDDDAESPPPASCPSSRLTTQHNADGDAQGGVGCPPSEKEIANATGVPSNTTTTVTASVSQPSDHSRPSSRLTHYEGDTKGCALDIEASDPTLVKELGVRKTKSDPGVKLPPVPCREDGSRPVDESGIVLPSELSEILDLYVDRWEEEAEEIDETRQPNECESEDTSKSESGDSSNVPYRRLSGFSV